MTIRVPDDEVGGTWAMGASMHMAPEVVTLDFMVDIAPEEYVVVRRIRLTPSALEPLYLELGALLQRRREAQG